MAVPVVGAIATAVAVGTRWALQKGVAAAAKKLVRQDARHAAAVKTEASAGLSGRFGVRMRASAKRQDAARKYNAGMEQLRQLGMPRGFGTRDYTNQLIRDTVSKTAGGNKRTMSTPMTMGKSTPGYSGQPAGTMARRELEHAISDAARTSRFGKSAGGARVR